MPRARPVGVRIASNGAYWQATWWTAEGVRRVKSLGAKADLSKSAARRRCEEMAEGMALTPGLRDKRKAPTLAEWLARYSTLRPDASAATLAAISATGRYLTAFFGPETRIDRVTPARAQAWRAWLYGQGAARTGGDPGDHIGEHTIRKHCRTAKTIFAGAVDAEYIAGNPFRRLKSSVLRGNPTGASLTSAQVDALIAACPDHQWRCVVGLCALAGLRRGEAWRLKWDDVRFDSGRIIIRNPRRHEDTKNRQREVRMEPALDTILLDAHERTDGPQVVTLSIRNVERRMRIIIERAGLTPWRKPLHTLRSWRDVTWKQVHPEFVVDAWLGHSMQVSRQNYLGVPESFYGKSKPTIPDLSSLSPDDLAALARAVDEARSATKQPQNAESRM